MNRTALTETDYERLSTLANAVRRSPKPQRADELAARLREALILDDGVILDTIVIMGSVVSISDPESGESYRYKLVFPADADISRGSISVLSPLGAALIGRRSGETFAYSSPGGTSRMRIDRVERTEHEWSAAHAD